METLTHLKDVFEHLESVFGEWLSWFRDNLCHIKDQHLCVCVCSRYVRGGRREGGREGEHTFPRLVTSSPYTLEVERTMNSFLPENVSWLRRGRTFMQVT